MTTSHASELLVAAILLLLVIALIDKHRTPFSRFDVAAYRAKLRKMFDERDRKAGRQ